jgi:hypothetical protein
VHVITAVMSPLLLPFVGQVSRRYRSADVKSWNSSCHCVSDLYPSCRHATAPMVDDDTGARHGSSQRRVASAMGDAASCCSSCRVPARVWLAAVDSTFVIRAVTGARHTVNSRAEVSLLVVSSTGVGVDGLAARRRTARVEAVAAGSLANNIVTSHINDEVSGKNVSNSGVRHRKSAGSKRRVNVTARKQWG